MEELVHGIVEEMGLAIERRHTRRILPAVDEREMLLKAMNGLYKEMMRAGKSGRHFQMMEIAQMIVEMYREIKNMED